MVRVVHSVRGSLSEREDKLPITVYCIWYTSLHATYCHSRRLTASEHLPLIELAATRLFARRGFAATTVEDIVRAAGVTKPMLYRHFESKAGVVRGAAGALS